MDHATSIKVRLSLVVVAAGLFACGGQNSGATGLQWFAECGPPIGSVDAGPSTHPGVPSCTTEQEGQSCAVAGSQCEPATGNTLVCATADPKLQFGGCPVSSRRFKNDIRYLSDTDLAQIAAEVRSLRLARYSYKSDPAARKHLGFIIEDSPDLPAVAEGLTQVDLYGYTSMVVAAMKVQAKKLDAQAEEIATLRRKIERLERRRERH
jgi:hypothetical protein